MATQKEAEMVLRLVRAALEVNESSPNIDVDLTVCASGVNLRICDSEQVGQSGWEWLYHSKWRAYFSDDVFQESEFLERCTEYLRVIESFKGYAPSEATA